MSSLPSWPSPRSALLHTEKARNPKVSGAPGPHCVEEKLLRLREQTEKSHMVAITAGTARVERTQESLVTVPTWTGSASPSRYYLIPPALRGSTQHPLTCYLREPCVPSALGRMEGSAFAWPGSPKLRAALPGPDHSQSLELPTPG